MKQRLILFVFIFHIVHTAQAFWEEGQLKANSTAEGFRVPFHSSSEGQIRLKLRNIVLQNKGASPHKTSGKVALTQEDFTQGNAVYIIRENFDLQGKTINLPQNCILQFDGGTITGGHLKGTVLNDCLNVKDFTLTNAIDEALENIFFICNNAYIPKGNFKLDKTFAIGSKKKLFGLGLDSQIYMSKNACILINKKEYVTIENLTFLLDRNSESAALLIDGMRHCKFASLLICSEASFSVNNKQTGILLSQSPEDTTYYGSTMSLFSNITISHVRYGIVLDCLAQPKRDYITSCTFSDVLIQAFVDSGLVIRGKRIYANTFNNLTIQDGFSSNVDRRGIDFGGSAGVFQGGYSNYFNNLAIGADAKGGEKNFYALYLSSASSLLNAPTYISGSVEGLIGSPFFNKAKWTFLSYLRYNINATIIDSKTKKLLFNGHLSNYNMDDACSLVNLMDINYFINNLKSSSSYELINNAVSFKVDKSKSISAEIALPYNFENGTKLKLLAQVESDGNADMQVLANGKIIEYKDFNSNNFLEWTETRENPSEIKNKNNNECEKRKFSYN